MRYSVGPLSLASTPTRIFPKNVSSSEEERLGYSIVSIFSNIQQGEHFTANFSLQCLWLKQSNAMGLQSCNFLFSNETDQNTSYDLK